MTSSPALILTDLSFHWPGDGFGLSVQDFVIARGERVLLLGRSGSGKSTLLSLICGINRPDRGRLEIDGQDLGGMRAAARDRFRADHIGVLFQQFNLLPYASVADNILLPLRFAPARRKRTPEPLAAATALCDRLGLPPDILPTRAGQLSVGQQQRVAAARALIGAPPLIVADEPTSALDADAQAAFLDLLFAQCAAAGTTLLMVSHDARLGPLFDRTVALSQVAQITRTTAQEGSA